MKTLWDLLPGLYFSPDDGAGGNDKGKEGDDTEGKEKDPKDQTPSYEEWLTDQSDATKERIDQHVGGLKSALGSERDARKGAEDALRGQADKLEKGSDAQKELLTVADELEEANRRVDFFEDAHGEGITNLKLAYMVAVDEGLIDKRGKVNFGALKEQFPELYGKKPAKPPGNAGDGTQTTPGSKVDMNEFIRKAAGKQK